VAPANAAPSDTWATTSTTTNTDGSPNLTGSGWTQVATPAAGAALGTLSFTRNGIAYTVTVNVPDSWGGPLLVANVIANTTAGQSWTYAYDQGDGATSEARYIASGDAYYSEIDPGTLTYYTKTQSGDLAVAVTGTTDIDYDSSQPLTYTEILDVTSDGRIVHNLTFTNSGTATLSQIGFSAFVDTMLNGDDMIPIIANGGNSVYIDNGTFRLYLAMLGGDQMLAGDYTYRNTLQGFVDVSKFAQDATVINNIDTSIAYNLNPADLAAGTSVHLAFSEQLKAPSEIVPQNVNVKYVDDDSNGAAVTPKAGTVTKFTGMPGDPVGFTEAMAQAGVPDNYVYVSVANVATYDMDATTDQTIVVHVKHQHATSSLDTTRTITYSGAGAATPGNPDPQTITWTVDKDLVTGVTTYSAAAGSPAVVSPTVDGYVPDIATVPAITGASTNTMPVSSTVAVTYKVLVSLNVVYVDDDANGQAVGDTVTLTGGSGLPVGFTAAQATIPTGYVLASIDNVANFPAPGATATITVHLKHHLTITSVNTTRTITYTGAGSSTPKPNVQTLKWTVSTDDITKAVLYSSTGYPSVKSPVLTGYTVNPATVPATAATASAVTAPTNSAVTVAYTGTVQATTGGVSTAGGSTAAGLLSLVALFAGAGALVLRRHWAR